MRNRIFQQYKFCFARGVIVLAIISLSGCVHSRHQHSCARKNCSQVSSCEEALYKLEVCGHHSLDRDGDGIPCEHTHCN